jgi:hypothetical protein
MKQRTRFRPPILDAGQHLEMLIEDAEELRIMQQNGFCSRPVISGYVWERPRFASPRACHDVGTIDLKREMAYESP